MKDDRDDNTEVIGAHMGNPGTRVYKGSNLPVPEKKEMGGYTYYDAPGVCGLCGSYKCSGSCFK